MPHVPRLPKRLQQEQKMLSSLSVEQVEKALQYLAQPVQTFPPPEDLKQLNPEEWFVMEKLLHGLMNEKMHSPLQ
jgi:hypothetical protein